MNEGTTLYKNIIDITEDYFGPAARRCIDRIIVNHLGKTPDKIKPGDVPELITWVKLTVALLTDDPDVVSEFVERLDKLANRKTKPVAKT
jgi:hypothetical protein